MGKQYSELNDDLEQFIKEQKMFFVATAGVDGRVNVSPKGLDSLRVLDSGTLAWLNYTGSGNETAAHVLEVNRITLMFCAFQGAPRILRIYGKAQAIHPGDEAWQEHLNLFPENSGVRQIFRVAIESATTSCGFSVPIYDFVRDRNELHEWVEKTGDEGLIRYQKNNNLKSIDGKPTGLKVAEN